MHAGGGGCWLRRCVWGGTPPPVVDSGCESLRHKGTLKSSVDLQCLTGSAGEH
jgi:hypothetical protein